MARKEREGGREGGRDSFSLGMFFVDIILDR